MNESKKVFKIIEQNVGTFLSRPTYEWQADGKSVVFKFSDTRTMREVQGYVENMRGGVQCKPWFPDTGDTDPFSGTHGLIVSWSDTSGNELGNSKKGVQFVIAKWKMAQAGAAA